MSTSNETTDDTYVATPAAYRPEWWGFDPETEAVTSRTMGNALDALSRRITAIGDLLFAAGSTGAPGLENRTLRSAGDILCDYAKQAEALSTAVGCRPLAEWRRAMKERAGR